jgi:hypothetical protein
MNITFDTPDGEVSAGFHEDGNYATLSFRKMDYVARLGQLINLQDKNWKIIDIRPSAYVKSLTNAKLKRVQ